MGKLESQVRDNRLIFRNVTGTESYNHPVAESTYDALNFDSHERKYPILPRSSPQTSDRGFSFGRLAPSYSSNSFEYNDPAEFERADDLLVRRPIASEHHADH
jgi:hypothetical protein